MQGRVLAALLAAGSAPLALAAPAGGDYTDTCTFNSTMVTTWTVGDFDFHASYVFSTPAHQNSWGYVNFSLANAAVPYKAQCSAQSSQLEDFFYGTQFYLCTLPVAADEANFTFSRPTGALRINQRWNCADEGSRFEARGGVDLHLECSEKTWQNPDWKPGQLYSTRNIDCNKVTVEARMEEKEGVAMDARS